ncbi:MAG: hypothetical protein GX984_03685 [Erysipelothrix sp.]|nr:hypothetical protein [Erysipelothrix sp.]
MRQDVGIAFSGGGIKSLVQPALIKWLEDHSVTPKAVSGTSAGAMIATLMAMGLGADQIFEEIQSALVEMEQRKILKISGRELFFNKELKHGLISSEKMESLVKDVCDRHGVYHISDVKIPLAITAVDLYTGELIVFVSHPDLYHNTHPRTTVISDISIAKAITASMSFPMVFGSMEFMDYALIDGGVRMNSPVKMLKDYGIKKTMTITMRGEVDEDTDLNKTLQVASRVYDLLAREAEYRHVALADYIINIPVVVDSIFNIEAAQLIYEQGQEEIKLKDEELKAFFKKSLWERLFDV